MLKVMGAEFFKALFFVLCVCTFRHAAVHEHYDSVTNKCAHLVNAAPGISAAAQGKVYA